MTPAAPIDELELPPPALMAGLDADWPALSAYPTAERFVGAIVSDDVLGVLRRQRGGGMAASGAAWGLRVVVPRREPRTLQGLRDEAGTLVRALEGSPLVARVHVDAALPEDDLAALVALLRAEFTLAGDAQVCLRVRASRCTPERLARVHEAGVHRLEIVADGERAAGLGARVAAARSAGFAGIALELPDDACLAWVGALAAAQRPDQIRLVSTPRASTAMGHLLDAAVRRCAVLERLASAGYRHIALREFALATDALAVAARQGRLHLGAGGLVARPQGAILALGPGAEGRVGNVAYRNLEAPSAYHRALDEGRLPVGGGLALGRDELARQAVISGLLCQGRVDFEAIDMSHLIAMRRHFAAEFALMAPLVRAGLVEIDDEAIALTATGRWFAPVVAAVFDRELQRDVRRRRSVEAD